MEETNMIEPQTTDIVTTQLPTIKSSSSTSLSSENEELERLENAPTIKSSSTSLSSENEELERLENAPTIKSSSSSSENEELERLENAPPFWRLNNHRRRLSKQLSMCETPRDIAWERRRRQIMRQERMKKHHQGGMSMMIESGDQDNLTDDDLNELKGSIELGFGFNELDQDGQRQLCHTLPALDLYFAVNRQVSPVSTPTPTNSSSRLSLGGGDQSSSRSLGSRSSSFDSPVSDFDNSSWKICSPGDNPEQVKMKLRHWALAVACSVMQSS